MLLQQFAWELPLLSLVCVLVLVLVPVEAQLWGQPRCALRQDV
jgi:hypothetical protein